MLLPAVDAVIDVDVETEWNLKEAGKPGQGQPAGRCRNRMEFKAYRIWFRDGSGYVDVETEWNLKVVYDYDDEGIRQ